MCKGEGHPTSNQLGQFVDEMIKQSVSLLPSNEALLSAVMGSKHKHARVSLT